MAKRSTKRAKRLGKTYGRHRMTRAQISAAIAKDRLESRGKTPPLSATAGVDELMDWLRWNNGGLIAWDDDPSEPKPDADDLWNEIADTAWDMTRNGSPRSTMSRNPRPSTDPTKSRLDDLYRHRVARMSGRRPAVASDREVLVAFSHGRQATGKTLLTDGKRLDGMWMGGTGIARWSHDTLILGDLGSRAAQTVQRALKKMFDTGQYNSPNIVYESQKPWPRHPGAGGRWPTQPKKKSSSAKAKRNAGKPASVDSHEAKELELYIDNDAALYQQWKAIVKNLQLKREKGTYNSSRAADAFMHLVDAGARKYRREFGMGTSSFSRPTRRKVAESYAASFESGGRDEASRNPKLAKAKKTSKKAFEAKLAKMYAPGSVGPRALSVAAAEIAKEASSPGRLFTSSGDSVIYGGRAVLKVRDVRRSPSGVTVYRCLMADGAFEGPMGYVVKSLSYTRNSPASQNASKKPKKGKPNYRAVACPSPSDSQVGHRHAISEHEAWVAANRKLAKSRRNGMVWTPAQKKIALNLAKELRKDGFRADAKMFAAFRKLGITYNMETFLKLTQFSEDGYAKAVKITIDHLENGTGPDASQRGEPSRNRGHGAGDVGPTKLSKTSRNLSRFMSPKSKAWG